MNDNILLRRMTAADADGVYRTSSEALPATDEERQHVMNRSPEEVAQRKERYQHFLKLDPEGAWVAVDGDRVAGVALALVREGVWVLSLFAVAGEYRDEGLGKRLLDRALLYAEGCHGAMIASSTHPAAMRRYALAGFSLQPTLMASGKVSRESLPAGLKTRDGMDADLELAARVDRPVRGAPHGPDLEFMLRTGSRLLVAEGPEGSGYAIVREGSPALLAATTAETATDLLWSCLADSDGDDVEVYWITDAQNWALPVVLGAGLSLSPAGPICLRGELGRLTPYLPSGPFL
jgi:ribosomal protein S18 acetylase RimI-like enzyme